MFDASRRDKSWSLNAGMTMKMNWTDVIVEIKQKLITGLVGAVLGVGGLIGVWLSPLKQIVMHHIWRESADLTLLTPAELHVGEPMQVLVVVMPSKNIPLSEGILSISISDAGFVVRNGILSSTTPQIAAPMILLEKEPLILQAAVEGPFIITAKLKNEFREYTVQKSILVRPVDQPTKENLSGQWHLKIGQALGTMELIHRGSDVTGMYTLAQPPIRGNIAGFADGATVNADLVNQGETRRKWLVRALYNQTEAYVEVKGDVTRQVLKNNEWVQIGKPEEFYATSDPRR